MEVSIQLRLCSGDADAIEMVLSTFRALRRLVQPDGGGAADAADDHLEEAYAAPESPLQRLVAYANELSGLEAVERDAEGRVNVYMTSGSFAPEAMRELFSLLVSMNIGALARLDSDEWEDENGQGWAMQLRCEHGEVVEQWCPNEV